MRKFSILMVMVFMLVFSSTMVSASSDTPDETKTLSEPFQVINDESFSELEKAFVEVAKQYQGVHHYGDLYVISSGAQPNSGYKLSYVKQEQKWEQLNLYVKRESPKPGTAYTDVIVYPYIVGRLHLPRYTTLSVLDHETYKPFLTQTSVPVQFKRKQQITDNKKTWKIDFNNKIKSVKEYKISIEKLGDKPGNHPIKIYLEKSKKTIIIEPTKPYESNCTYLLRVKNLKTNETSITPFEVKKDQIVLNEDFSVDLQGWRGDFADLPINYDKDLYQLEFSHAIVPFNGTKIAKGLLLSGINRSDDLFMFAKKKFTKGDGLAPNTTYFMNMEVVFYTDVNPGLAGVGGSPGEGVYVKAGASSTEPKVITVGRELRMNIDKGEQATSRKNAIAIGNIAKEMSSNNHYELKTLKMNKPIEVRTNKNGELWAFFGTDSGFEGKSTIYYNNVLLQFTKK